MDYVTFLSYANSLHIIFKKELSNFWTLFMLLAANFVQSSTSSTIGKRISLSLRLLLKIPQGDDKTLFTKNMHLSLGRVDIFLRFQFTQICQMSEMSNTYGCHPNPSAWCILKAKILPTTWKKSTTKAYLQNYISKSWMGFSYIGGLHYASQDVALPLTTFYLTHRKL